MLEAPDRRPRPSPTHRTGGRPPCGICAGWIRTCAIIDRVGPCRLEPKLDRFGTLVRAIIGQQISTKAAASIHGRLVEIGGEPHRPDRLIELGEDALRGVGLSGVKARYVLNLAEAVASGAVPLDAIDDSWDDAKVTEALVSIKGIGVWTAEMFLIFALNRPDVLPVGDLGVRGRPARPPRAGRAAPAQRVPRTGRALAALSLDRELVPLEGQRYAPGARHRRGRRTGPGTASPRSASGRADAAARNPREGAPDRLMMFDLIIKGGWVIDGSGGPPFRADVALLESMIAEVGRLDGAEAPRVLDAAGRYVVPGFIDAHVHGDLMLLADPIHLPALRQGVTTYIIGQDGSAFAPASPETLAYMRRYTAGFNGNPPGLSYDWRTVDEYLSRFDRSTAINVAYLIPNGNVRMEVMGLDPRPATDDELAAMQRLVREGMDAGAVGLSTGLDYIPSLYADAREIAALCEAIAPENGVYVTHMRGYDADAPVGMREVCEIARTAGVAAHVSHYNGPAEVLLPLVDQARAWGST